MGRPFLRTLRIAALPLFWLLTVGLMVSNWIEDPYAPVREGTRAYGHNHEGALVDGLVLTSIEVVILLAILRPWSWDRSWGRTLVALVLLLPWTMMSMMMSMHAGGIILLHAFWLMLLVFGLGCVLVSIVIAALVRRR